MSRWKVLLTFTLNVLFCCAAAQDGSVSSDDLAPENNGTCRGSSSDVCVRTCCPEGQNIISDVCAPKTVDWVPTFLNESDAVRMVIVPGFVPLCKTGYKLHTFSDSIDPDTFYTLQPSGELFVVTSIGDYDLGYDYCFYNIESMGVLFEGVKSCQQEEIPQVDGLISIDDVAAVPVQKCCPDGQSIGRITIESDEGEPMQDLGCIDKALPWNPTVLQGDPTTLIAIPNEKRNMSDSTEYRCVEGTSKEFYTSTDMEHANFLLPNGSLYLPNFQLSLAPGTFCQDQLSSSNQPAPIVQVCYSLGEQVSKSEYESRCEDEDVCILKCCAPGYYISQYRCVPGRDPWTPTFHRVQKVVPKVKHRIVSGQPYCDESADTFVFSQSLSEDDTPYLQFDGIIRVPALELTFKRHECCIDYDKHYNEDTFQYELVELAICCHQRDLEAEIRDIVSGVLLTISCIFLFIMLAIYMLVPSLRNIHGKCLMSHAAALFVAFSLTAFNQFVGVSLGAACDGLGLLLYYSFIAALFWLNVMSFDIWWTFANLRTQQPSERSLRNRFVRHSLYAWGVPLLMTCLLAFFNYAPDSVLPPGTLIRPDLGERKCFLSHKTIQLYYFYVPIFIVTGVNIVFFVATAWTLFRANRNTQKILKRKRTARDRLKVYVNLFIIMEVSWIAECLSTQIEPKQAWYFTDIINASQGTLIFILFIARKSTRDTIRKRFKELFQCQEAAPPPACPAADERGQVRQKLSSETKTTHASSSSGRKTSEDDGMPMAEVNNGEPQNDPHGANKDGAQTNAERRKYDDGGLVNDVFQND